jgi:hypothetical protein
MPNKSSPNRRHRSTNRWTSRCRRSRSFLTRFKMCPPPNGVFHSQRLSLPGSAKAGSTECRQTIESIVQADDKAKELRMVRSLALAGGGYQESNRLERQKSLETNTSIRGVGYSEWATADRCFSESHVSLSRPNRPKWLQPSLHALLVPAKCGGWLKGDGFRNQLTEHIRWRKLCLQRSH